MEYPDLWLFPPGHPPSPYPDIPVRTWRDGVSGYGVLPGGLELRAVGWLHGSVFTTGKTPELPVEMLLRAHKYAVLAEPTMGWHECLLCDRRTVASRRILRWRGYELSLIGEGHYLVELAGTVYMSPELVPHYILEHDYRPPEAFLRALERGRFVTMDDLEFIADDGDVAGLLELLPLLAGKGEAAEEAHLLRVRALRAQCTEACRQRAEEVRTGLAELYSYRSRLRGE